MFLNKPDINSGSAIARNIRSSAYLLICLSSSSSCTTFSDFRFSPSLVSKMSASFMIVSLFVRISEICCLLLHQLRRARALLLLFESKKTSHLTALFNAVVLKRIWLRILIVTYKNIHDQIGTREKGPDNRGSTVIFFLFFSLLVYFLLLIR